MLTLKPYSAQTSMKLVPLVECALAWILPFCSDVYFSFLRNFPPPPPLTDEADEEVTDADPDAEDASLCVTFCRALESKSSRRLSSSL